MPLHGTHGSATHACIIKKQRAPWQEWTGKDAPAGRTPRPRNTQTRQADSAGKNTSSAQRGTHYRKVTAQKLKEDGRGCVMIEEGWKRKEQPSPPCRLQSSKVNAVSSSMVHAGMDLRARARLTSSSARVWCAWAIHAGWPGPLRHDALSGLLSAVSKPN